MRARIRSWRRRQRSHILFVTVPADYGTTIVASGRRSTTRLRMIEVQR